MANSVASTLFSTYYKPPTNNDWNIYLILDWNIYTAYHESLTLLYPLYSGGLYHTEKYNKGEIVHFKF